MSLLKKIKPEFYDLLRSKFDDKDLKRILAAVELADIAHRGQLRRTGEPYIHHPVEVAYLICEMNLDCDTIITAILHDLPEDTNISVEEISRRFGKTIAFMVDGVTKLSHVRLQKDWFGLLGLRKQRLSYFEQQIETIRKMIMATSKDMRIILIKLADKIHNMRTIEGVLPEKRLRFAKETLDIYAPIAERLNIGKWKGELEDLTFPIVYPEEYKVISELYTKQLGAREKKFDKIIKSLLKIFSSSPIKIVRISGRIKHKYSFWKKLKKVSNDYSKIYDLIAFRIITTNEQDCYTALGLIHKRWKPLPGLIKDYIAQPKPNGYQSLHTTVYGPGRNIIEIQIRTQEMHEEAEEGIAAHWHYSDIKNQGAKGYVNNKLTNIKKGQLIWLKELARWQKQIKDSRELEHALSYDFFKDRIFVYTPQGDVRDLPEGSTPIDFAYSIHSDIGNKCSGARVNGKLVGFDKQLKNGDVVEVITNQKSSGPKWDWLEYVKTSNARSKIKSSLK